MSDICLELKKVGAIAGKFNVPDYQRGFRWKDEVEMLLRDINEIEEGANYCLQPIVVKKIGDNKFELVDGQQRLTTILLIYRYIRRYLPMSQINFSMAYDTRAGSTTKI